MKCKIFIGTPFEAQDLFNQWAKGKALTREVLIHEQVTYKHEQPFNEQLMIIVYHPEDPYWDKTEPTLTAPVHQKPEPPVKVTEMQVTQ